jgi:molybdenum cofactor synthesis domain-containing protein
VSSAGVVLIGDEILSGKVADENAIFLIAELRALGVALRRITVIPDVLDEISATVKDFAGRFDHVFTSGGVGPTHDDLTMEGVARAFGRKIIRHPLLEQLMRGFYGERLEERNLRMCDVPEGCELVAGDNPSWPVVAVGNVYVLPGVPQIFRGKFKSISERFRTAPWHLKQVFSSGEEGTIAARLDDIVARFPMVSVGSYPTLATGDYRVKVTLEGKDATAVDAATAALVEALGGLVVRVQ